MVVQFITLGCKTNLYESDAMAEQFRNAGHTVTDGTLSPDLCVINTCTVTGTGAQKSRQQIRRAKRKNPNALIAVCGCLAQIDAEHLRKEMDIDILLGNKHRDRIVALAEEALSGAKIDMVESISKEKTFEELGISHGQSRVRANLKIEDGCNNFCSYCIIPYARGPVRSRSLDQIVKEATALGKAGYGEVVLTGIHIGSYGKDRTDGITLIDVMEAVHAVPGIQRLRLGSLEPITITQDFVARAAALPNLCPQFHLSLQSGCDATLARMKRRYTTAEYREAVGLLRQWIPHTAITTDLMVGFAGETQQEFEESYAFCKEMEFAQMHIFPYSIRQGTAAAKFPNQVSQQEKSMRSHQMLTLAETMKDAFYRPYIGQTISVLAEQKKGDAIHGTTANYMDVLIHAQLDLAGQLCSVLVKDYKDGYLLGSLVSEEKNK